MLLPKTCGEKRRKTIRSVPEHGSAARRPTNSQCMALAVFLCPFANRSQGEEGCQQGKNVRTGKERRGESCGCMPLKQQERLAHMAACADSAQVGKETGKERKNCK
jgi:hypothetical protein